MRMDQYNAWQRAKKASQELAMTKPDTVLTDAEIATIASTPAAVIGSYVHTFARAIEQAVLAKRAEKAEPVA